MCKICKEASETTGHVLWSCLKAQEVWGCSKVTVRVARTEGVSFLDIMWQLLMIDGGSDEVAARVSPIAWALWNNRNEMRNGGERKLGQGLVQWAMEYLAEYGATMELTDSVGLVVELPVKWTPPREGWFKINVNGAIFSKQKSVRIGVLITDELGGVEAALSKKVAAPLGAVDVEAKALKAGLMFARDVGLQNVVLEGDSLVLINALRGTSSPLASIEPIVMGVMDLCREFRSIAFSHVRRQGNKPAHL
ncbi:uncharacterized protein LOC126719630 [Quercus robur]|uniref:uncharacterized protein LOC126719630 n=1 Tax=Quercus robur TaxID=38942 RepID=UPI002162CC87|nr:uncharacterized protein LOC126719630 [Quercus robur]